MSKNFTTNGLSGYLEQSISEIEGVRKEVEEIQLGFQSAYVEWKTKHDAELASLSELVATHLDECDPELQQIIREQAGKERKLIEERREELRTQIIPKYEEEADHIIRQGQAKTGELRNLNPELNRQEENLKARLAENQKQLEEINQKIRSRSKGLGGILFFKEISELDRQRQRLVGQMEEQQKTLQKVRRDWDELHRVTVQEQGELQTHWQQVITELAQRQAELSYLDDEPSREMLVKQRAIQNALDNLKTPVVGPSSEVKVELDKMVEYNQQTDVYHAGLASVGGLIGMLGSIQEGMHRFNTSVESLAEQERMHSQYLKPLNITVPDLVLDFNRQWAALKVTVTDEKTITAHPADFSHAMQPVIDQQLSTQRLKEMFEALGVALRNATEKWN